MTNQQRNKLSMYLAVLGVLETYRATWAGLAGLVALVETLQALVQSIQDASGVQGTSKTGIAGGKKRKQLDMIQRTAEAVGDLHAVAIDLKDDELIGRTDVELSDLINMADTLVGPYCRSLHTLCLPYAAALAALGTTAQDLTELDQAIKDYLPLATAPRQARVAGKVVTGDLKTDLATADALASQQLDKAMRKFKRKQPEFFNAYSGARIIVDLGGGPSGEDDAEDGGPEAPPPQAGP